MNYEKNIPIPEVKNKITNSPSYYSVVKKMINEMEIGDSVLIEDLEYAKKLITSMCILKRMNKGSFISRKQVDGIRFWKNG
ncbi:hypothetical protein UFOVP198_20 [uncultured Caudovirales phage]|uniref:Uncharacterized protein n=1 Tax=uncultured Caudovirales phage TaxID=2100421 RepID=A0A6J7WI07_9CAUD|nr:hypothetical protein UFOVP198_20 [uncultured Caudovirales phage]